MPDTNPDAVKILSDDEVSEIAAWKTNSYGSMVNLPVAKRDALCATVRTLRVEVERLRNPSTDQTTTETALREQLAQRQTDLREQRQTIKFWQRHIARMGKLLGTIAMDTKSRKLLSNSNPSWPK